MPDLREEIRVAVEAAMAESADMWDEAHALLTKLGANDTEQYFGGRKVFLSLTTRIHEVVEATALKERNRCLTAVQDEPELPGDPPPELAALFAKAWNRNAHELCRDVVRATKRNIAAAIESASPSPEGPGGRQ